MHFVPPAPFFYLVYLQESVHYSPQPVLIPNEDMEEPRGEGSIDRNTRSPGVGAWSCLHGHYSMLRHTWLLSTHVSTSPWGWEDSFMWICADRTHCVHCFAVCLLWWHSICIAMLDIYCYIVTTTHNRAGRHLLGVSCLNSSGVYSQPWRCL